MLLHHNNLCVQLFSIAQPLLHSSQLFFFFSVINQKMSKRIMRKVNFQTEEEKKDNKLQTDTHRIDGEHTH
jgi:hypothetical protein